MAETVTYARAVEREGRVPMLTKIGQGIGALPGSHKDFAFNTLLLLYYSQILGVSASWAAGVLAMALFVDAITDPMVGSLSDNFRSRLGRRHPFMYAAAVPLGVAMYFLFSPPSGVSENFLLGWMLGFTLLVRIVFTFFVVPWNALAAEFSQDYEERTSIITYRYLVGWTGGVIFTFAIYTLVLQSSAEYPAGQLDPGNYPTFAVVVAVLVAVWSVLTTRTTQNQIPYLLQPTSPPQRYTVSQSVREIGFALSNRNFRIVFINSLIFFGVAGVGGVFDIYMNTFFWDFSSEDLRWFTLTIAGAIAAFIAVPSLQRRFEKHHLLVFTLAVSLVLGMFKVLLRFADVWPDNGDPLLLQMLIIYGCAQIFAGTVAGIMAGSMIADLVDEQEMNIGRRQEGLFSAALSLAAKATSSIGLIVGGLLLDLVIRFPVGSQPGTVEPGILFRLAFTDGIAVPMFYAIPIYFLARYTLTRARVVEVQAELATRRETTPKSEPVQAG